MATRTDCIDEILEALGGRTSRADATAEINDLDGRAQDYQQEGLSAGEAYARARDERLAELGEHRALARRAERLDAIKAVERHRYYAKAPDLAPGLEAK